MSKPQFILTCHHTPPIGTEGYGKLRLCFSQDTRQCYDPPRVVIEWQCSASKPDTWYGFSVTLENAARLERADIVWRKVSKALGTVGSSPAHVALALLGHADEAQWSEMDGTHIPIHELAEPGTKIWADMGAHDDPSHATVWAYGDDESDAVRALFKELAKDNPTRLERWILAGKRVRLVNQQGERKPTLADILKPSAVGVMP